MKNRLSRIGIFGASGFSREAADVCYDLGCDKIIFIDINPTEQEYFGFPVVSERKIPELMRERFVFIIGIGDNKLRQEVFKKYSNLEYPNIIHPTATMGYKQKESMENLKGNIITSGVRFTNNIQFGNFGIFNLNCTVGHDCILEDFINIAPGATISGNVHIKKGVYVGTNAAIIQGESIENKITIGTFAIIGAGAVVTKDILHDSIAVGVPARVK